MKGFKSFLQEEKGQALLEYILFSGGIIMGTVVIFVKFAGMANAAATDMNSNSDKYVDAVSKKADEILSESL